MARTFLTRDEVRDVDRRATEEYGLPGIVLMENAGRGCAALIDAGPVVICCGKGNNGGDGFVIARHLDNRGIDVEIILTCAPDELRGDAKTNCDVARKSGLAITVASQPAEWLAVGPRFESARWIVDALLGTGFTGPLREPYGTAIRTMNNRKGTAHVLAVDVPSGLDVETGVPSPECVKAELTVTFVAMKPGFLEQHSGQFVGRVEIIDIGVPRHLLTACGLGKK